MITLFIFVFNRMTFILIPVSYMYSCGNKILGSIVICYSINSKTTFTLITSLFSFVMFLSF
jgi:hypothetical protein